MGGERKKDKNKMSEILRLLGLRPNLRTEPTIQTYSGTYDPKDKPNTNDQNLTKYDFEHYYIAEGRNEAAERFLDQLNEHNNRSANATLHGKELDGPTLTKGMNVDDVSWEVDEKSDFMKIKQMPNMNASFCRTNDGRVIYHWQPDEKYLYLKGRDDIESLFTDKLVDRYVTLKREGGWKGWYYLFHLATFIEKVPRMKIYEVTDESGKKAHVPVMLHMPALTIQHTRPRNKSALMRLTTLDNFLERVQHISLDKTIKSESFRKDVEEINERTSN